MTTDRPGLPVLFDEAFNRAVAFANRHLAQLGREPILVRDIFGCLRVAIDDRQLAIDSANLPRLASEFHRELGAYSPGESETDVFLLGSRLFAPDALFGSADVLSLPDTPGVRLLERQITGQDWLRPPLTPVAKTRRATLYGIKGGVGRSTALAIWAKSLAEEHGKRVLVVDLDLESPGISSMLLPSANSPDFGLVDYLVEEAVGQGEAILERLSALSPLVNSGNGEIRIVPAQGAEPGDYLAKLSRIYQGIPAGPVDFAARVFSAISRVEESLQPDVVLLDSRAGLHDIAAMAVTRLQALALLFAVNTRQTFDAYRLLFESFRRHPQLASGFRNNLQAVAALVPPTERSEYLGSIRTNLYNLFAKNVYEEETGASSDVFNFSVEDPDAPHAAIPIHWYQWFLDFDPIGRPDALESREVRAAFGAFTDRATQLLLAN
jgi:CheY-like chemotaxis protein